MQTPNSARHLLPEDPSIMLVNPPALRRAEYHDTPAYPNISTAYLAGALRKAGFRNIHVLDAKLSRLSIDETVETIILHEPTILGFTGLTNDFEQIRTLSKQLKKIRPEMIVVCGGVHVSTLPQYSMEQTPEIDYVVINEGELTFPRLLRALASPKVRLQDVPNLCYRGNSGLTLTEQTDWIEDLDSIEFPAWDLFPPSKEYPIITARGCPFGCRFCNPMGTRVRERSAENVLQEVQDVTGHFHPEFIWFFDETFGLNKTRASAILNGFIKMDLAKKVSWFASTRINTTTPEFMNHMYEAGCRKIGFGIEGGSERILGEKRVDVNKAEQLIRHGRELGMTVFTYFILGHPNETVADIKKTIRLAARLNSTCPVFGIMVPYPGTEIYEMAKNGQAGYKLVASSWNDYNKHIGNALKFTQIGNLKMETLRIFAYVYFFIRNRRFRDFFGFCREYFGTALGVLKNVFRRIRD